MSRFVKGVNLGLFVILVIMIARVARRPTVETRSAATTIARSTAPKSTAIEPRITAIDLVHRSAFTLDFGRPMVGQERIGTSIDPAMLSFEPELPFGARWRTTKDVDIRLFAPAAPATVYTVLFADNLKTSGGEIVSVAADRRPHFETERLELTASTIEEDDAGRPIAVVFGFNMPVKKSALAAALAIDGWPDEKAPLLPDTASDENRQFRVELPESLRSRDEIAFSVKGDLRPSTGNLPLLEPIERRLRVPVELTISSVTAAARRIDIACNRRLTAIDRSLVTIDPPVPFTFVESSSGGAIVGDFGHGRTIAITLEAGFPGVGRARLTRQVRRSMRIPDAPPALDFAEAGEVLTTVAEPKIPISLVNVDQVTVAVRTVYPNNIAQVVLGSSWERYRWLGPAVEHKFGFTLPRNEATVKWIGIEKLLGKSFRGVHEITLDCDSFYPRTRILRITDLGITARMARQSAVVMVRSIARGTPVPFAFVKILSAANQEIASGVTGENGLVTLTFKDSAVGEPPALVVVECGDDSAYLSLGGDRVDLADEELGGREPITDGIDGFIAPARDILRPGETLDGSILLRRLDGTAPARGRDFEIRLTDPSDVVRFRARPQFDSAGVAAISIPFGIDWPTGTFDLTVVDLSSSRTVDRRRIRAAAYVPQTIEAFVAAPKIAVFGATYEATIQGRFLDGGPAGGSIVHARVIYRHAPTARPGYEGFSFSPTDVPPPPGADLPIDSVLDADGRAVVRFSAPPCENDSLRLSAEIEAEVEDPTGRTVFARTRLLIASSKPAVGVNAGPSSADVVLLKGDGSPFVEKATVEVDVERRTWRWKSVILDGTMRWETEIEREVVAHQKIDVTGGRAEVPVVFVDDDYADYVVVARAAGATAEERFDPSRGADPDRVRVVAREPSTRPGENATLLITSPLAGRGLLTLESSTIDHAATFDVVRGQNIVTCPIPAGTLLPNLHAVVTVFAPQATKDGHGPYFATGATSIAVRRDERKLDVAVRAEKSVRPESTIEIGVVAKGASSAVVTLVDEGILAITGFATPDPFAHFTKPFRITSIGADSGESLMVGAKFAPEALIGGDDGDEDDDRRSGSISRLIRSTALTSGIVELDAEGRGNASFRLPPYEGRLRVMVVAAGRSAIGSADASVVVSAPLGIVAAMPRIAAPGDEWDCPITIRRNGATATVELSAQPIGDLEIVRGFPTAATEIPGGGYVNFLLRVRAGSATDTQGLAITAITGADRRTVETKLLVRPPVEFDILRFGFSADADREIEIPGSWITGKTTIEVSADPRPEMQLGAALAALYAYPHGCTEQIVSQSWAIYLGGEILANVAGDAAPIDPKSRIEDVAARIFARQRPSGGLALWDGDIFVHNFASIYALDFLTTVKSRGYAVDAQRLHALSTFVERQFTTAEPGIPPFFAAEVLSRARRPIRPWLDRLRPIASSVEDRAMLAAAYFRLGDKDRASALLAGLVANSETTDSRPSPSLPTPDFGETFATDHRTRAVLLRMLTEIAPNDPNLAAEAASLCELARRPDFLTTQDTAQIVRAVLAFDAAHADSSRATRFAFTLDDRDLVADKNGRFVAPFASGKRLGIKTDGRVFGVVTVRGFRTDPHKKSIPGVAMERTIVDARTGQAAKEFKRGGIYDVTVEISTTSPIEHMLVNESLPGGFEFDPHFTGPTDDDDDDAAAPIARDVRDDRIFVYYRTPVRGKTSFTYRARAVFSGRFAAGDLSIEPLYRPGVGASFTGRGIEVSIGR